ncbi:hypothetical protein QYZ44_28470 [Vibrio parahaemolyticus]|nr:hypothetical protein [Vibrio parahaemolyticus]
MSDSIGLQCSLEEEMAKNHQHVMIVDLEDAHKILHNVWLDAGKNVAALAMSINTVKSWLKHAFVNGTRINMDGKNIRLTRLSRCKLALALNLGLQTLKEPEP